MILRRSSQADSDNPILTPNIGGGGGGGGGISTANATILIESNDNVQRSNQTDPNTIKDKDRTKMDLNEKEHQSVNDETKQSFMEKSRHIVDDVGDNNNDDDDDDDDDDAMIKASSNDIRLKNSQAIPNESNNRSASDKDDIGFEMNIQ
ncbi:hypothetical protein QR98_0064710 [Sarcoptes scabiei]|uniref:Uncharacterized protein n=1 Tax=Sarcoptes scabiei TaxID=52283 RepID=A0A132AAH5_SARSC|nr:hypothetical protein QR98_0064710 [Sarcoptes scabiei]